ncbi:MAG: dTDP-4-dehydrorhamnose reductase [Verrucomicrobia bacterium]|nr:MAG: dTDP-4-dehydrorhamnose reductase [Verrucomicrobiota bacterium]
MEPSLEFRAISLLLEMKIAIIGSNGRLGAALVREYQRDYEVTSYDRSQFDLGQVDRIRSALAGAKFELLINCAALTNVDYCESHREEAFVVNAETPRLLAKIANEKSAKLVHFSTDYVFDGKKMGPYVEEDKAVPLSVYGESKLEGERRVLEVSSQNLVVRLSWVFGPDKPSFIDQIIQRARESGVVTAVADKFSAPTYTIDVASWLRLAVDKDANSILHLANNGGCSWQEWAQYAIDVCRSLGIPLKAERVGAVSLADMKNFVAQRPVYTVLSTSKFAAFTGVEPRHWRAAVAEYISAHVSKK